jgi:hypothetical protein
MTAFSAIVTALVANLSAPIAVSANIYRTLLRPLPDTATTAVVVRLQNAAPDRDQLNGNPVDMTTQIAVECYARSSTTTADLAVDALLESVYTRLMSDQTLGGTVMDINCTALQFGFDAEAQQFAVATLTLDVRHRTSGLTLT